MAQVTQKVTEVEKAKRTELNNKIKEKANKCVEELKTILEIKDSAAKADELTKVFAKNVDTIAKKVGEQKKASLQKTVDKRVATIVAKADSDQNGKIDFEGEFDYSIFVKLIAQKVVLITKTFFFRI